MDPSRPLIVDPSLELEGTIPISIIAVKVIKTKRP